MLKRLIKIANELDKRGLVKEADTLDKAILLTSSSFVKKASMTFSLDTNEWIKRKELCPNCELIEYSQREARSVLEQTGGKDAMQARIDETESIGERIRLENEWRRIINDVVWSEDVAKEYPLDKTPAQLCKEEWDRTGVGYSHDSEEEGMGYRVVEVPPGDTLNLTNRNAIKMLRIIGFPPDPEDPSFGVIPANEIPQAIRNIIRLINVEGATDPYTSDATVTQEDRGRKIIINEDGLPEIKRDRGATMVEGGIDSEYIIRKLEQLLKIFTQAAEHGFGVVAV
jgi:hypothetical protein